MKHGAFLMLNGSSYFHSTETVFGTKITCFVLMSFVFFALHWFLLSVQVTKKLSILFLQSCDQQPNGKKTKWQKKVKLGEGGIDAKIVL